MRISGVEKKNEIREKKEKKEKEEEEKSFGNDMMNMGINQMYAIGYNSNNISNNNSNANNNNSFGTFNFKF